MSKNLNKFLNAWRALRSTTNIDIDRLFRYHAYRLKSKDLTSINEIDLQTHLYLNVKHIFPECIELILYERPLIDRFLTNSGCYDFVFLTKQKNLKLIETKVIDTEASGSTAQTRRRRHRRKVVGQVLRGRFQLVNFFNIPENMIECAIFTTDPLVHKRIQRDTVLEVDSAYISLDELRFWFKNKENYKRNKRDNSDLGTMTYSQKLAYP